MIVLVILISASAQILPSCSLTTVVLRPHIHHEPPMMKILALKMLGFIGRRIYTCGIHTITILLIRLTNVVGYR